VNEKKEKKSNSLSKTTNSRVSRSSVGQSKKKKKKGQTKREKAKLNQVGKKNREDGLGKCQKGDKKQSEWDSRDLPQHQSGWGGKESRKIPQ